MIRRKNSSLVAISIADQNVNAGDRVRFDTNRVFTGGSIRHTEGGSAIVIPCQGQYLLTFDADFTITTTGQVTFQLLNREVIVQGAETTVEATATEPMGVHFTTILDIPPSCQVVDNTASLQVTVSAIGVINTASISIIKVS